MWFSDVVDSFAKCRYVSLNTGIIENFEFEGFWKVFRFQPPCLCQGHLPLNQVADFFKGHFPKKRVCAKPMMKTRNDFSTQNAKGRQSVTLGIHLSSEYELLEWLIMNQIHLIMNSSFTLHWAVSSPQHHWTGFHSSSSHRESFNHHWRPAWIFIDPGVACETICHVRVLMKISELLSLNSTKGWPADLSSKFLGMLLWHSQ